MVLDAFLLNTQVWIKGKTTMVSEWTWKYGNGRFGLTSLFNGISTFVGYLMPKPSFSKNSGDAI